jgi:acetyltransferase-like isoleucine patch superfamily enzyme
MNVVARHVRAAGAHLRTRVTRAILRHRVMAQHPTLRCDPTVVWDYGYSDLDAIEIGQGVVILPYCEIVVHKRNPRSEREGKLVLEDNSAIAAGVNIRAAGGRVRVGRHSGIGQHSTLVAVNHQVRRGMLYLRAPWDTTRAGIDIGDNVWIGANSVVLPGVHVGDNAVVAAGSVVTKDVPAGEIWGGVPARKLKDVPDGRS